MFANWWWLYELQQSVTSTRFELWAKISFMKQALGLWEGMALHSPWWNIFSVNIPESKVRGAYMGPTWGQQDPCVPHEPCYQGCYYVPEPHRNWSTAESIHPSNSGPALGPVSLRLMTSQFKDIITHTQKYMTVKCTFYGVWVQNFVWNFKGALWNFTQNFEPIHRKICILRGVKDLTTYDILELWHLKS